ncbi:MAG: PAS domain S-box protein [Deltaproteobacteria bacterium]|nr:PAS domain S-box protein [Deltaproteobacteria bacterium]
MNSKTPVHPKPSAIMPNLKRDQHDVPTLITAIVGGGNACYEILKRNREGQLDQMNMKVMGVSSADTHARGFIYAGELGIFTTADYKDLYAIKGLNLIIELTGSLDVMEKLLQTKPRGVSLLDHRTARMLWIAETHLWEEEKARRHTQTILDSLPYRLMVVNTDMTIDMVNKTFLKENNLVYEKAIKKKCHKVRYQRQWPCYEMGERCYLNEVKKTGKPVSTILELKSAGGKPRFDVITVSPIFDDRGNIVQVLETARDITDRIRLQREVQQSKIFFQNVIQSSVDGIVVVDPKGHVLIFNEGMERLTGYTVEEIMDTGHLSTFYNIDTARKNMQKMRSDEHGPVGKLNPTTMSILTKSGEEIPVTLSAAIVRSEGKEIGSVGAFTDMQEILQMRRDLGDAHLQLVQSDKIASVGRMAAGVAHEINNPLAGVLIYAELLKESLECHPEELEDVDEIIKQTLRCKKIVSELLEFSRQSIGSQSAFELEKLIDTCLNLLTKQAAFQDIRVIKRIEPGMPTMLGDMGQLQQVFTNLFINASDAMEGVGTLHINAEHLSKESKFVIRVSDEGPGIPLEMQGKIFDIFYTSKPVGKGTGLGLSISQNIINLHGGSIRVECPPEGGATFIIELPLESAETSAQKPLFIGLDE